MKVEDDNKLEQMQAAFAWIIRRSFTGQEQFLLPPPSCWAKLGLFIERAAILRPSPTFWESFLYRCRAYGAQDPQGLRYWIPGALIDGRFTFSTLEWACDTGPDGKGWRLAKALSA